MSRERPILFSAPMVRAILDGSKTQTRRVANFKPREKGINLAFSGMQPGHYMNGRPNSGFVLRSSGAGCWNDRTFPLICPYGQPGDRLWVREAVAEISCRLTYRADTDDGAHCLVKRWTPSIHMPRIWSRILLEIVSVRVERLQDISEADAKAEGAPAWTGAEQSYRTGFYNIWKQINGAGSWDANPWVWVVEFKRVAP